jgi:biotin carboxyl carrier protein
MKKYNVTVNGTAYEITLEVVDAADVKAAPVAPAPAAAPAPVAAPVTTGGETVTSPMPGTILSVNVQNGATVNKGDVLMILEAIKMENEIIAPVSGTIASVNVQNGASVETGATLCVIA